ncbi:Uncharacterised protein [Mycobacteroides abscessus subsp. bolletii]|nr:Uncharacterised protein [Mycobacteroides abscessus subsp. bolletii]
MVARIVPLVSHRWMARSAGACHSMMRSTGALPALSRNSASVFSMRWRSAVFGSSLAPLKVIVTVGFSVRKTENVAVRRAGVFSADSRLMNFGGLRASKTVPGASPPIVGCGSWSKLVGSSAVPSMTVRLSSPGVLNAVVTHRMRLPKANPRIRPCPLRPLSGRWMLGERLAVCFHDPPRRPNCVPISSGGTP